MYKNTKRILLFDIDGTLLDPLGEGHTCMRRALEEVYGTAGPIESYDMSGKTDWQIVTELMALAGLAPEQVQSRLQGAFAAYARHVAQAAPTLQMHALPGVPDLLEQLVADERFHLGLLTGNVREAVPYKLTAAGIDPAMFQFGAFGSEDLNRNALPELALTRAGRQLGGVLSPESALVIGDTPRDIACARHAGMKVLCVATGGYSRETLLAHSPDFLVNDLCDLEGILEIVSGF